MKQEIELFSIAAFGRVEVARPKSQCPIMNPARVEAPFVATEQPSIEEIRAHLRDISQQAHSERAQRVSNRREALKPTTIKRIDQARSGLINRISRALPLLFIG